MEDLGMDTLLDEEGNKFAGEVSEIDKKELGSEFSL